MLFHTYTFLFVFLPLTLVIWLAAVRFGRPRIAIAALTVASLVFFAWWHPPGLLCLLASVAFNYLLGTMLGNLRPSRTRSLLLAAAVSGNLLYLAFFKYLSFVANDVVPLFGGTWRDPGIALPLAISFFTFQQIAYLVDVARGKPAVHQPLRYLLFVSFFPQLIAGPIVYYSQLIPQFSRMPAWSERYRNLAVGSVFLIVGLFQKTVLADLLAPGVDAVYGAAATGRPISFADAWMAAFGYSLQIYYDFCGYSNMAVGLGRMFGISLPFNFNSPYMAASFRDFWRRWHITLSTFFRDYLYIPLGGNRHGAARNLFAVMVVMILGGLWHGAGWMFMAWGALHGLLLVGERLLGSRVPAKVDGAGTPGRLISAVRTFVVFLVVTLLWVLFRGESLNTAAGIYKAMLAVGPGALEYRYLEHAVLMTVMIPLLMVAVWILPNCQELVTAGEAAASADGALPASEAGAGHRYLVWRPDVKSAAVMAAMFAAVIFAMTGAGREFIYFRF